MTDHDGQLENDTMAALMDRVAIAFGRNDPAPDPTLIMIKAELAERVLRERRASRHKLIGITASILAVGTSAWIALQFAAPALASVDTVLAMSGASLLVVPLIVWFFGLRPLSRAL
jgi:hypothetical protein